MIDIVYDVEAYRRALSGLVKEGDRVVEIGPHIGKSTDAYISHAGRAVLVDKGADCADSLKRYCEDRENAVFLRGDARSFETMAKAKRLAPECDILAVDMGGGRFPDTVFKVWATWAAVLKPVRSIIRCRGLAEFLAKARVIDESLPKEFPENGWLSEYGRATPYKVREQLEEFDFWVDV